eukprot:TRINITY_DN1612_c0_g1_i1.p1 TRINITY_DN1612_c0_g1~~TRINITY_DN1612_c0_g1_i1.p1  ORF type:complete len:181 (-),score=40.88 TRINITY_DN1612_c0_g1_i1:123-614(-)
MSRLFPLNIPLVAASDRFLFPSIVTCGTLALWTYQAYHVGNAREKYGVRRPAVVGHPIFEKIYVMYQDTVEQIPAIIPSAYLYSFFVSPVGSLALGSSWILARLIHLIDEDHLKEESSVKRLTHIILGHTAGAGLLLGSMAGVALHAYRRFALNGPSVPTLTL